MLFAPFGNLGEILVLFPDIILLRQVDEINDRLRGQEEQRVDDLDLRVVYS